MVLMASEGAIVIGVRSALAAGASLRGARTAKGIELPPGRQITLEPGAMRIVLSGLVHPLKLHDRVPLVLTIQRPDGARQDISVDAEVRNGWPVDAELRAHRH
jgi:copper(I)-binding protein